MYIQGILTRLQSGKYGIVRKELSCGDSVEVYINGHLIQGTIQANNQGEYYFLGNDKKKYILEENMCITYFED